MQTKLPKRIRDYDVEEVVRRTQNFVDYRATHHFAGYPVRLRNDDPTGRWRRADTDGIFLQARALQARLHHPNILPIKDVFEHDGCFHTVFQHLDAGRRLSTILADRDAARRPSFELEKYVRLCEGLTSALSEIHAYGFLHGSIGKGLILVDESWNPLVEDIAFAIPQYDGSGIRPRQVYGVPRYMAPEQFYADGSSYPTTASDVYALGVLLFDIRYGRHPVPGADGLSRDRAIEKLASASVRFPRVESLEGGEVAGMDITASGRAVKLADDRIRIASHAVEEERLIREWLASLLEAEPKARERDAGEAARALRAVAMKLESRPVVATAFVIMPFAGFSGLGEELLTACLERQVRAVRGDELFAHDSVWRDIEQGIRGADFVLAACYGTEGQHNANVMVEVGLALAHEKPLLVITDDPESLPFDLRTLRAIKCPRDAERDPGFRGQLRVYIDDLVVRVGGKHGELASE